MNRKLAAALSGAALALALAGCGDDGENKELDAWAKTVCDAAKPQVEGARVALSDLARVNQGEKPADLKARLSGDVGALAKSKSERAKSLDAAGPPPVDDGEKLQQDAVDELRASAKAYTDLKKQLDGLDTKDKSKFAEGLEGVGAEIKKLGSSKDEALKKLESGDVRESMTKQASCKPGSTSPNASTAPNGSTAPTAPGSPSATSGSTKQPAQSPSPSPTPSKR